MKRNCKMGYLLDIYSLHIFQSTADTFTIKHTHKIGFNLLKQTRVNTHKIIDEHLYQHLITFCVITLSYIKNGISYTNWIYIFIQKKHLPYFEKFNLIESNTYFPFISLKQNHIINMFLFVYLPKQSWWFF